MARTQVLIRVVKRPRTHQGERLALFLITRTADDPAIVVYSFTAHDFRTEPDHRELMDRTRRATPTETGEAVAHLAMIGEQHIEVLQGAPRVVDLKPVLAENPDYPEYYLPDDDDPRGHT